MNSTKLKIMRKVLIILIMLFFVSFLAAGSEIAAVWSRLYRQADTIEYRFKIMTNIVEQHNRDMIPVLSEALDDQILHFVNISSTTEKVLSEDLMKMIVKELGNLKAKDAAPIVYRVIDESANAFMIGEAIIALGLMGARTYAEEVALILRNLNMGVSRFTNKEEQETIVSACVIALERLQSPDGFKPVFFVSIGRYSRSVIKKAERALINMVEDPSDVIGDIILTEKSFEVKLNALNAEFRSLAPPESKANVAAMALEQGLVSSTLSVADSVYLSRLKIGACQLLAITDFQNEEAIPLLQRILFENYGLGTVASIDETLAALNALSKNHGDLSVQLLSDFLEHQNNRQSSGVTVDDYRVVRATIFAIGATGNIIGQPELLSVEFSNWTNAVVRDAKAALKNF